MHRHLILDSREVLGDVDFINLDGIFEFCFETRLRVRERTDYSRPIYCFQVPAPKMHHLTKSPEQVAFRQDFETAKVEPTNLSPEDIKDVSEQKALLQHSHNHSTVYSKVGDKFVCLDIDIEQPESVPKKKRIEARERSLQIAGEDKVIRWTLEDVYSLALLTSNPKLKGIRLRKEVFISDITLVDFYLKLTTSETVSDDYDDEINHEDDESIFK